MHGDTRIVWWATEIPGTSVNIADSHGFARGNLYGAYLGCSQVVRNGVDGMTKRTMPKKEDYKTEYLSRVAANPIAKVVKIADASHNLSKAHLILDQVQPKRLRKKYTHALQYLDVDPIEAERPIAFVWQGDLGCWKEKE